MKRIFVILIISVISFSCKKAEPKMNGYVINGTAAGVYDGVRAHLKIKDERGRDIIQDTAIIFDGKFTFEGKIDTPAMWVLSVNSVPGEMPIIIENSSISVILNKDNIQQSKIEGSKSNDALTEYYDLVESMSKKRFEINSKFKDKNTVQDAIETQKIAAQMEESNQEMLALPYEFIKKHDDNFFSLVLIESLLKGSSTDFEKLENTFQSLDNELKNSILGNKINSQLVILKQENEKASSLNIGKVAPDFSAPKADGQLLALNNIKGKVTIIDFWAAWCGPCRRENPNVVNVYNKYHSKGLEIIGVSLDRPGQKDKWLKAIEDDKLTWHHVSYLQYFNDPVAQLYQIKSIPATYILDSNGIIVAKNLRGPALEAKIAELLN